MIEDNPQPGTSYINIGWADTTAVASPIVPIVPTEPTNGLAGMSYIQMYDRYKQYRKLYSEATAVEIVTFMKTRPRLPEKERNAVDRLTYWLEDKGGGYITIVNKNIPRHPGLHTNSSVIKHYSPEDIVINTNGAEINAHFKLFIKHRRIQKSQPGSGLRRGNINKYELHSYGMMESLPACCGCVVISSVSRHRIFQDYLIHLAFTMNYGIALCSDVVSSDKYVYHKWETIKSFVNPRTKKPLIIKTIDIKHNPPIIHPRMPLSPWVIREQKLRRGFSPLHI